MRRLRRMAAAATVILTVLAVTSPVAAMPPDDSVVDHTDGGSSGTQIHAVAGAFGGSKKGGRYCGWQPGWPDRSSGAMSLVDIPSSLTGSFFNPFGGIVSLIQAIFGDDAEEAQIRILTEAEAVAAEQQAEEAGEDVFIFEPVGGDGEHVEIVEGVDGLFDQLILFLSGPHDLGILISDPYAGDDVETLSDEQLSGEHFLRNDRYPMIQRGVDPTDPSQELWWDPWYVSIEASETYGCSPGVIYSPRVNNPTILLPDIVSLVTRELPPVQPKMIPLDRDEGWAYVQVPTNFGVAAASLEDKYAHAEVEYIDGGVSQSVWAEVHAVPTHLVFTPGDGSESVTCRVAEMAYDPDDPGPCSHVYLDSSDISGGNVFTARVSVIWAGIYRDSAGANRVIDIAPTTASFDIAVAEARPSN